MVAPRFISLLKYMKLRYVRQTWLVSVLLSYAMGDGGCRRDGFKSNLCRKCNSIYVHFK